MPGRDHRIEPAGPVGLARAVAPEAGDSREALSAALLAFGARNRLLALADASDRERRERRAGDCPDAIRRLAISLREVENSARKLALPERITGFRRATQDSSSRPRTLRRQDLAFYRQLNDLVDLDLFFRTVSSGRLSLPRALCDTLPAAWVARPTSALACAASFTLRGAVDGNRPPIPPDLAANHAVTAHTEGRFDTSSDRLTRARWFDRVASEDLSLEELLRDLLLAPVRDYEHAAPLELPPDVEAVEVGSASAGATPTTQLWIHFRKAGGRWMDVALIRGPGGFLSLDPALLAGTRTQIGVRLTCVCGTAAASGVSPCWVTVRWGRRAASADEPGTMARRAGRSDPSR